MAQRNVPHPERAEGAIEGRTMVVPATDDAAALYRLMTWLSPSYPIGAYSYSHGIEYAVEADLVRDRETLCDWVGHAVRHGAGLADAALLAAAWRVELAHEYVLPILKIPSPPLGAERVG